MKILQSSTACAILALCMACVTPPTQASADSPGHERMRTILKGSQSSRLESAVSIIKTKAEFSTLWATLGGGLEQAPTINFSQEIVCAIFMGQKPTGGYGLEAIRFELLPTGQVKIILRNIAPGPNDMVTQVLTSPFILVAIPKGSLDPSIVFED